jgi:hypothetical protein
MARATLVLHSRKAGFMPPAEARPDRLDETALSECGAAVTVREMPLPEGEQLAEVARESAASGDVVYLTDHGQRLAAIVPARLAELLERSSGGRRVLGARACGTKWAARHL